eukprot:1525086-Prymnesium_polylepis.1
MFGHPRLGRTARLGGARCRSARREHKTTNEANEAIMACREPAAGAGQGHVWNGLALDPLLSEESATGYKFVPKQHDTRRTRSRTT